MTEQVGPHTQSQPHTATSLGDGRATHTSELQARMSGSGCVQACTQIVQVSFWDVCIATFFFVFINCVSQRVGGPGLP